MSNSYCIIASLYAVLSVLLVSTLTISFLYSADALDSAKPLGEESFIAASAAFAKIASVGFSPIRSFSAEGALICVGPTQPITILALLIVPPGPSRAMKDAMLTRLQSQALRELRLI